MDFRPSPAQQLLVATARDFLKKHCAPEHAQAVALDPRGFDDALWRRMAELGWQGLLVPGEWGGSDGSLLDVILLVEEIGRAAAPGPFVPSAVVATSLLVAAGSAEQKKRLLPAMAAGERIVGVALGGDGHAVDVDARGRLTGRALFVEAAHVAHELIVATRGGDLVLVPTDRPGLARLPLDAIGPEKLFEVTFDGVTVSDRLDPAAVPAARDAGALARTAEMVGAAARAFELTVEHAKTRVQGGRPIGGHQAIQHACADLVRDVDASRGLLYAAAWKVSEGAPAAREVAMAKAYASEACLTVARRAHQIFGAIGYCEEHPLHLLHKRIHAASLDAGDPAAHLETVARAIGLQP
ncbi:MAG TPA: acyl-CoA dehydrogenase family protein [Methylomirabilota bacterium]|jgi:alkylation response protein AidB-like acyl-CoA dehydrogenase|nr:acyl-CoA dehydrogenase family protein [Methylomirabilota bacterium]